ncbi:MAG TPA: hypothetical protein VL978_03650 [Puia sp.]|nr:hypothetical protein [Puia sp.]
MKPILLYNLSILIFSIKASTAFRNSFLLNVSTIPVPRLIRFGNWIKFLQKIG